MRFREADGDVNPGTVGICFLPFGFVCGLFFFFPESLHLADKVHRGSRNPVRLNRWCVGILCSVFFTIKDGISLN